MAHTASRVLPCASRTTLGALRVPNFEYPMKYQPGFIIWCPHHNHDIQVVTAILVDSRRVRSEASYTFVPLSSMLEGLLGTYIESNEEG